MSVDLITGVSPVGKGMNQAGVMIPIEFNGNIIDVILDSGAQRSIYHTASLHGCMSILRSILVGYMGFVPHLSIL